MVNRRNTEKIAINKRISELKQQAFGASMNPHFIFNALSSVQYFINNNRNEEANNYLIKLSRLIRLNLNAINKSFITIEEELEKLEYYISLEKMRFSNKINFIVNVDPLLDKNTTLIPNMILQPFIENALWHGLLPSSNKEGMIKVDFLRTQEAIIITIRDNGIGLKAAKQNKQTNHVSKGISLIANRLEILDNPINSLEIVDLLDGFGNSDGTLVTLSVAHYFVPEDSGIE